MIENFPSLYTEMLPTIVKDLRRNDNLAKANKDAIKYFAKYGIHLPKTFEYEIIVQNSDEFYFVIPNQINDNLTHDELKFAIGGKAQTYNCASSVGTLSTAGCIFTVSCELLLDSTASSLSTLSLVAALGGTVSSNATRAG